MLATLIRSFICSFRGATEIQSLTTFTFLCRSWHPVQMKTTPGQHWQLLSCGHFLLQSTSWSSLVSRWRAPGRITRGKGSSMHTITFLASTSGGHTPRCTLWKNTANQCKPTQCALFCTVASVSHTPNPHDCMQAQLNLRKAVLTLSAAWNLFLQCAGCALQRRADWWVERVCTLHTAHHPECTQAVPRLG